MNESQKFWSELYSEDFNKGYLLGKSAVKSVALRHSHTSFPFVIISDRDYTHISRETRGRVDTSLLDQPAHEIAIRSGARAGVEDHTVDARPQR
jgi:hypothetical protein